MEYLLEGKKVASLICQALSQKCKTSCHIPQGLIPHLAIILVGNNLASELYVHHKLKACHRVGFKTSLFKEPSNVAQVTLLGIIERLNRNPAVHGIIIQLPLPEHLNSWIITQAIEPHKDVDGLHVNNYGRMARHQPSHIPATPLGILLLLAYYKIETAGKHCVVIGRGATVGAPLSILLSTNSYPGNATVTLCHHYTKNLSDFTRQADILVVAVGKPSLITPDMVKAGVVTIDVGITRIPDSSKRKGYRLQGDVIFETVAPLCSYITPVPGGVGPMTIAALLTNTFRAATQEVYTPASELAVHIKSMLPY